MISTGAPDVLTISLTPPEALLLYSAITVATTTFTAIGLANAVTQLMATRLEAAGFANAADYHHHWMTHLSRALLEPAEK